VKPGTASVWQHGDTRLTTWWMLPSAGQAPYGPAVPGGRSKDTEADDRATTGIGLPQASGSAPPNASGALAMPQHLWYGTLMASEPRGTPG
jgi:hypothetical protein